MNSSSSSSTEQLINSVHQTNERKRKRLKLFSTCIPSNRTTITNHSIDNSPSSTQSIIQSSLPTINHSAPQPSPPTSTQHQNLPSLSQLVHHPPSPPHQSLLAPSSPRSLAATRILRTRKPAQLKPYTMEIKKYISKLHHNGWQDAVVRLPQLPDPTTRPNSSSSSSSAKHHPSQAYTDHPSQAYSSDPLDIIPNHPGPSQPSTPDESQIGQFCLRKFHKRRRHSNDPLPRRRNQPQYRRSGSQITAQDSWRSVPKRVRRSHPSNGFGNQPNHSLFPANFASQPTAQPSRRHDPLQAASNHPPRLRNSFSSNPLDQTPPTLSPNNPFQSSLSNPVSSSPSIVIASHSSPLPSPSTIPEISHPKKVKLNLLNRMMPRVYVTAAEKDLKLMEQEKRAGKLKLTIDSDSSDHDSQSSAPRRLSSKRAPSRKSLSISSSSDLNLDLHARTEPPDPPHHQPRQHLDVAEDSASGRSTSEDEDNQEEEEEEEESPHAIETLHPKKVKLKLLNRMMPRVYVTKAEKDLKLMEQEKRAGKLKLTVDSDSSDHTSHRSPVRQQPKKRLPPRKSLSMSNSSEEDLGLDLPPSESSHHQPRQRQPAGMTWGARMCMRMNRTPSSTSHRNLERSVSNVSSVTSRVSQSSSSRATRVVSQLRNKTDSAISLKDDHALWKTYESANGRPALNLPPPDYRREVNIGRHSTPIELPQVPIWNFKDFTPDFGIERLPAGLTISSQIEYLKNGHISEFIQILDGTTQYTIVESYNGFDHLFSAFMPVEEWQQSLSSVADRLQDELSAWLAVDPGRSKDALLETARWFQFLARLISSVEFNESLIDPMVDWVQDLMNRVDDLAVDAINRPEFSHLMLLFSWGVFEVACRLDLRRRRSISWETHQSHQAFLNLGRKSICNLLRRLLEYGPPVTMGKIKCHTTEEDQDGPLFDVSVELWASLLNIILAPIEDRLQLEYLTIDDFWTNFEESTRLHSHKIELSQVAHGEAICYLTMMICGLSQISSTGVTVEETRIPSHWSVLVDSLGQLPETALSETVEARMRERRDRYVRSLFGRILVFHERWNWQLRFDDGMIERLYKIMNAGRLERLSIEVGEMSHRYGLIDSFPNVINDTGDSELRSMSTAEEIAFGLKTNLRQDDSCFGMFLKILVIGFKSLPRPTEASKQKEVEKIISRCNPLRQLNFKPLRELGPIDPKISDQNRSALINHSSLFLVYSILFPNTIRRQWSFLEGLYNFPSIDHLARSTHIRILVKFAKYLRPAPVSGANRNELIKFNYLNIVIKKLLINFDVLKVEYSKLKERQLIILERLKTTHNASTPSTTTTTNHFIPSMPKEIFKKNSIEESNLKVESNELMDSIGSRIRLIVQIFNSLIDLFEYFSIDFGSNHDHDCFDQDFLQDRLIYPPIFWLDSSWSTGLDEFGLIKEKEIMIAFNEFVWKLLEGRQKKMKQISEYSKQIKFIEESFKRKKASGQDFSLALGTGVIDSEEVSKDEELVTEKKELEEKVESFYKLDQEWIDQLNQCSIYKIIQKSVLFFIHNQQDDEFFPVRIRLVRSLGWIDRLKNQLDANFSWLQHFKSIESQMGFGIAVLTTTSATTQNLIPTQKNKNRLKLMTILLTSLMTYLISNLEAYKDEPAVTAPSSPSLDPCRPFTQDLARIYRGQVRFEILRIWIYSLTFLDFTIQFKFTCLMFELENLQKNDQDLVSDSVLSKEDFLQLLPSPTSFENWLEDNDFYDDFNVEQDKLHSHHWWESNAIQLKKSTLFESKRVEFFNLIFNEMKQKLSVVINEKSKQHADVPNQCHAKESINGIVAAGRGEPSLKSYLNFYKKIIGHLSESISNLNRNLLLVLNLQTQQTHGQQQHQRSNQLIKESNQTRSYDCDLMIIEKKFKKWKFMIKLIIQNNFGTLDPSLLSPPSNSSNQIMEHQGAPNQAQATDNGKSNHDDVHQLRDQDGMIKLNYFFNFSTLNQLRLLKSILSLV